MSNMEKLQELLKSLTDEERAALLGKGNSDTYKVRDIIQITFASKPSKETREELKKAEFHWNAFEKVWQAYATDVALALVEQLGIKEVK